MAKMIGPTYWTFKGISAKIHQNIRREEHFSICGQFQWMIHKIPFRISVPPCDSAEYCHSCTSILDNLSQVGTRIAKPPFYRKESFTRTARLVKSSRPNPAFVLFRTLNRKATKMDERGTRTEETITNAVDPVEYTTFQRDRIFIIQEWCEED